MKQGGLKFPEYGEIAAKHRERTGFSTHRIMLEVILSLVPAAAAAILIFGPRTMLIMAVSIAACVLSELVFGRIAKRKSTVGDLSAAVTGLLLALNLPVSIPLWMAALGGVIAVVLLKQAFGGIGKNPVNPALTARIVLMIVFPSAMTAWIQPFSYLHADGGIPGASTFSLQPERIPDLVNLFFGNRTGALGETCAFALLLGLLYLLFRRIITPVIPICTIGTAALLSLILGRNVPYDLLSGSLLLAAFFMATDYTTSPTEWKGQAVFAAGCGIFTILLRQFTNLPDTVPFAVVLMNFLTPLIEAAMCHPKRPEKVNSETAVQ
jgi:electron transport complex protein RnfD